jgi:hypothetical protein
VHAIEKMAFLVHTYSPTMQRKKKKEKKREKKKKKRLNKNLQSFNVKGKAFSALYQ